MFIAVAGGCTGSGQVHYSAEVTAPELVYVSPGVQVVADYHEPVFYNDNFYWRYEAGVWYRSRYHTRDWVRIEVVPVAIRRIERPTAYIRYRGQARAEVRDQREPTPTAVPPPAPVVRDHRDPAPVVAPTPPPPPAVRDHRDDKELRKEDKQERKDLKNDQKEERKEERRDDKREQKDLKNDQKEERRDDKREQKDLKKDLKNDQKEERKDHKDHKGRGH